MNIRKHLQAIYLDYFNNYLTIELFAEHNELSAKDATELVLLGAKIHEQITQGQ